MSCSHVSATVSRGTERSLRRCRISSGSCATISKRPVADMRAYVHRISASAPNDVSGIARAIAEGRIRPGGIVAILGKTEGNGNVNDFTRGCATQSLTLMLERHLGALTNEVCLVMSGGTEGGMAPHWTVFERREEGGRGPALAIGRAHTRA